MFITLCSDAEKVKTEIKELKTALKDMGTKLETDLKAELTTFEDELKAFKIKKFERDSEDYRRGMVYNWNLSDRPIRNQRHLGRQHRNWRQPERHHDLLLTSEAETSDPGHTSASSTDEIFLGVGKRGRRKRRGGGNERRDPNRFTRSLHQNIR